ncbi:MAG: acyltransferase [Actinomycetota bacterium]|nr:acyltransferase [Actinomycetota bacterium]
MLLVALNHAGIIFMNGGYIGVDVFFVLSGFLITGVLVSGAIKHRSVSLLEFYARRARRILPAAALTLVVTDIVAYHLLNFVRAKQVMEDSVAAALFTTNFHFANQGNDYFARSQPPSPILHFWTLAVEEQFYLVWPAILALVLFGIALRHRARRHAQRVTERSLLRLLVVIVAAAIASLAWSIHDTQVHPISAYFSSFTRAWELALGAALAIASARMLRLPARSRVVMGWLGLIGIGAAGVLYSSSTPFPGYAALLPTTGSALVIAAGIGNPQLRLGASRLLALAPLRYIGDRSYTFYLWHWPFLIIPLQYEGHELSVGVNVLLLLGAFLLSIITYKLFENPIRKAKWSNRVTVSLWPVSASIVIIIAGFSIQFLDNKDLTVRSVGTPTVSGPASRNLAQQGASVVSSKPEQVGAATNSDRALPGVVAAVKAARRGATIPSALTPPVGELLNPDYSYSLNRLPQYPGGCAAGDGETTSTICRLGDTSSRKSIVLMGDSHAEMWMPAISRMAEQDRWVVLPLVKSGCTPDKWIDRSDFGTPECRAWYRWAVRQAKALHPEVMLIAGGSAGALGTQADAIVGAFTSLGTTMKRFSKRVVILADAGGVSQQPVDCLLAPKATMRRCTTAWPDEHFYANDDLAALAKRHRFGFIHTKGWFCFENQCPMVIGHTIVYRDTGHVTQPYALALTKPFRAAFRRAIRDGRGR